MTALYYDGGLSLRRDYPVPAPGEGESLVRVLLAGICSTDLEIAAGYMAFRGVPGHEFVGVVVKSGTRALVGKRVVGEINCPCGECALCRRGLGRHCPNRSVLGIAGRDGAFAEYLVLPDANLHPVPPGVSDDEAVFTEPLAAACRAFEHANAAPGEKVLILGDGRLGILIARVFAARGVPVTLLGRHARNLELAAAPLVTTGMVGDKGEGRSADVVIEATGSASGLPLALSRLRPEGRLVLKTTIADRYRIDLAPIVVDEITVIGSRCGSFEAALDLIASGGVELASLVSARYPLDRAIEAFAKAAGKGVLKVLLETDGRGAGRGEGK